MNVFKTFAVPTCAKIENSLAPYVENDLSAQEVFALERHLTGCQDCTRQVEELRQTALLLQAADRHDTSHDFMAKLHAQLDEVQPEPITLRNQWSSLRDWLSGARSPWLRSSAAGFGLAAALGAGLFFFRPASSVSPVQSSAVVPAPRPALESLHRNVALSATTLFEDPAAANLEAHTALDDPMDSAEGGSL